LQTNLKVHFKEFIMFKDKNILVTGGAGFVATNLIQRLLNLGAMVTVVIHKKEPQIRDPRIVEFLKGDLTNRDFCKHVCSRQDYIFMCAANTSGAAVMEKTPLVHVTPNIIMNALMLEAAYEAAVEKFLFISSNTVYPFIDHPLKEDETEGDLFEKYFCVGSMKRFSETLCEMYSSKITNPMATVVIRPSNIYGPYDDFEWATSHSTPALIRRVIERHNPIEVWGDGSDAKDLIYIDDFIEGMLLAMKLIDTFDPINIASGQCHSIIKTLRTAMAVGNYIGENIIFDKSKPTMIPKREIDTSKAKNLLDFKAETSLREGIRKTINWYKENKI